MLNSQETLEFYSCEYLKEEIGYLKGKVLDRTGYTESHYHEIQLLIYQHIQFVSEAIIPFEYWKKAADFVREVDMDDIAFVSLALFLDGRLWTGDKNLREGLLAKGLESCISTQELLQLRTER